jgi:hypothetical protein
MNTFSEEEINLLLKNPLVEPINIDERVDNFWNVNRMWVPAGYQKKVRMNIARYNSMLIKYFTDTI